MNGVVVCHGKLNEQAQRVLRFMVERGGITRKDGLELDILNVPARILDIRTAYGPDAVETEMMPEGYAVWRFRGFGEAQGELFNVGKGCAMSREADRLG